MSKIEKYQRDEIQLIFLQYWQLIKSHSIILCRLIRGYRNEVSSIIFSSHTYRTARTRGQESSWVIEVVWLWWGKREKKKLFFIIKSFSWSIFPHFFPHYVSFIYSFCVNWLDLCDCERRGNSFISDEEKKINLVLRSVISNLKTTTERISFWHKTKTGAKSLVENVFLINEGHGASMRKICNIWCGDDESRTDLSQFLFSHFSNMPEDEELPVNDKNLFH